MFTTWIAAASLVLHGFNGQSVTTFTPEPDGVRHVSGFFCPTEIGEARLAKSGAGSPVDPGGDSSAFCEYEEDGQRVAYLLFSATSGPVLTDDWCQRLPDVLRLQRGPRLPGVSRYEGVDPFPEGLPAPVTNGQKLETSTCTLSRAPFTPGIIVYSVAAFEHEGWTVRAVNTPIPPPCCNGYPGVRHIVKDLLALVLITETARKSSTPT